MVRILLKSVRARQMISVRRLAKLSGISKSEICRIEGGEIMPRIDTLCNLAEALGVKPEELYEIEKL